MTLFAFALAAILHLAPDHGDAGPLASAIAYAAEQAPIEGNAEWTAALLVVTAWRESRFDANAFGDCIDGRCNSCSHYGLWVGPAQQMCARFRADWELAAVVAREAIRASLRVCVDSVRSERLAFYLSGKCDRARGQSRDRMNLATWLYDHVGEVK